IDCEHGAAGEADLLAQLQATASSSTSPIVRVSDNQPRLIQRALDLGAAGVMIPRVHTAEQAAAAVLAAKFPPKGERGVASMTRASSFGMEFVDYLKSANEKLVTIVQIESTTALSNLKSIAAQDGVDVLFVGPLDLSVSL